MNLSQKIVLHFESIIIFHVLHFIIVIIIFDPLYETIIILRTFQQLHKYNKYYGDGTVKII